MTISEMYDEVYEIISTEITSTANAIGFDKNLYVYKERTFSLLNKIDQNGVYIVVHFEKGTLMIGGTILPVYIEVLGEEGSFDKSYDLLLQFVTNFNYKVPSSNSYIQQVYTTPDMPEKFGEVQGSYRSLMSINGTFVYGETLSAVSSINIDGINVLYTNLRIGMDLTPNTADLGNNNNRTKTLNKFGVFTATFNFVSIDSALINKIDQIVFSTEDINSDFTVIFTKNGVSYTKVLKLTNASLSQELGGVPNYAVSFVE